MRQLSIDRFEGKFAICEDAEGKYFAIETAELPEGAGEGDILRITDEGELTLDQEETRARREPQSSAGLLESKLACLFYMKGGALNGQAELYSGPGAAYGF